MTLEALEAYVQENKHLPNIPSAQEVSENGVGLTEFSMRLLEKIEEQTLYTIAQEKTIVELETKVSDLEARLAAIEQRLEAE